MLQDCGILQGSQVVLCACVGDRFRSVLTFPTSVDPVRLSLFYSPHNPLFVTLQIHTPSSSNRMLDSAGLVVTTDARSYTPEVGDSSGTCDK